MASPGSLLIIVENLPVPFDRRVWMECRALAAAGYDVSVISPKGVGAMAERETLEGVHVYRHDRDLQGVTGTPYRKPLAGRIDIDVASGAGAGASAFRLDAGDIRLLGDFHDRQAGLCIDDLGGAIGLNESDFGHGLGSAPVV